VPIACINDPVNYEQDQQMKKMKERITPTEVLIKSLKIKMQPDKFVTVDVSNLLSITEVK